MKKLKLMIGVTIGAMVFGLAAVAAAPYAAPALAAATATTAPGVAATTAPSTTSPTPNASDKLAGDQQADLPGLQESDLLNSAAASVTGLTPGEVTSQLQAGQTLTQIATAKGKTAADVIAAARTALSTGLQQAVTAGTITQAQSDAELAEFDTRAPQMVNNTGLHGKPGRGNDGIKAEDALVTAAASVTGLTPAEVATQMQAGQTLTQIATAKGKTAADVIAAARTAISTQLQQAVTAASITQAQADAQLASFDQQAPQLMTSTMLGQDAGEHGHGFGRGGPGGPGGPGGEDALISAAASVTGLTPAEVTTQLQAGQSLAQIATAKGKTADDVIAAARTALTTQLQQEVTAGRITQAQSDAKLAQFNQSATQIVNDATLGQEANEHGGRGEGPNEQPNPANPTPTAPAGSTTNS